MLNQAAKRWIQTLQSNKYEQSTKALRRNNTYCCLGVACDLHDPFGWKHYEGQMYEYKTQLDSLNPRSTLTLEVQNNLNLRTPMGEFEITDTWLNHMELNYPKLFTPTHIHWLKHRSYNITNLAKLNDSGKFTFHHIAAIVESEPPGLFRT